MTLHERFDSDLPIIRLGLDLGSTSIKAVTLDAHGEVRGRALRPLVGELRRTVLEIIDELGLAPDARLHVGVTGQGRRVLAGVEGAVVENEVLSLLAGVGALGARTRSVIEIGGQISRYIELEASMPGRAPTLVAFALNDQCAAGAGAFLTQQASRLKMDVAEFARVAGTAATGARIAGRCAVFAKSDMIHLQQKGVGVAEIAYGLCLALARNFVGTVLRGRVAKIPVALAGGGALNPGLVRAFREVLGGDDDDVSVLPEPVYAGAIGAATLGGRHGERITTEALRRTLGPAASSVRSVDEDLAQAEPSAAGALVGGPDDGRSAVAAYLGVDLGSVSTDLVLLRPDGELVAGIYLPTRGRPIEVLAEGLGLLRQRFGTRLRVLGLGTTGSGRHLAARLLGADLVQNEITAQLRGAVQFFPEVDSIFEIGGQDSKYINTAHGRLADFTMNKVCAAGTGSFLEEQCENLGLDVKTQFAPLAARSSAPAELGARCTVFMETELVNARRSGAGLADLAAGLALAVARNYLQKVVAHRPIGRNVVFQGGVANNAAVRTAFEKILGRPVAVHPHAGLSGAIGVALLARDAQADRPSKFKGLDAVGSHYDSRTFECLHCENRCEVAEVRVGDTKVHFGDTCERYTVRDTGHEQRAAAGPDLFAERDALLRAYVETDAEAGNGGGRRTIGLPRASSLFEYLPFWATLLRELGLRPVLSPPSSSRTLELGNRHLPAETCLPIKMAFGHVASLQSAGVEAILVPSVVFLDDPPAGTSRVCPFTSAVPFMARAAIDARIVTPELVLGRRYADFAEELRPVLRELGVSDSGLERAYERALAAQAEFRRAFRARGEALLRTEFAKGLVVVGRPYNLGDPFLNLNLGRHLQRLGITAFPQGSLPCDGESLDGRGDLMPWRFPRDAMRSALFALRDPRLHTVLVTNFGCGPDGFVQKYLGEALADRPPLVLEFDEHRGEAGMVTRIEAYLDQMREQVAPRPRRPARIVREKAALADGPFYIPYIADHVYALEGALRYLGAKAEVLPPPTAASVALGEAAVSGKECHAYAMVAGDMLRFVERLPAGERASFLYFGSTAPCLLTQWGDGYRLMLAERGVTNLKVLDPNSAAIIDFLGMKGTMQLWRGFVLCDLLTHWLCETRPYETVPGSTDAVHAANVRDLSDGLAADDADGFVTRAMARMAGVAVQRSAPRPLVGVSGDIYTRINYVANLDLFRTLEAMGCEVWPSSFLVDVMDFSFANAVNRGLHEGRYLETLATFALLLRKDLESWKSRRRLSTLVRRGDEPGYRELRRLTAPYVGPRSIEMLLLDVGKIADFADRGADGVVHAICLNCMLGTAAAALLGRIRKDYGIPVVSLVYGASEAPAQRTKLEAFVHQVREHHRARSSGPRGVARAAASILGQHR